jgi:hypothetical protein
LLASLLGSSAWMRCLVLLEILFIIGQSEGFEVHGQAVCTAFHNQEFDYFASFFLSEDFIQI